MRKYTDIHFRMKNREEKELVEKAACADGKKLSEYAREILLAASGYQETAERDEGALRATGRRNCMISIRLSEEEMDFYARQAEKSGCSVSEYIRRSANNNRIVVIPGLTDMAKQIGKLGANINQLTVLAHMGRIKEVDLYACNDTLKQILNQLTAIKRKG